MLDTLIIQSAVNYYKELSKNEDFNRNLEIATQIFDSIDQGHHISKMGASFYKQYSPLFFREVENKKGLLLGLNILSYIPRAIQLWSHLHRVNKDYFPPQFITKNEVEFEKKSISKQCIELAINIYLPILITTMIMAVEYIDTNFIHKAEDLTSYSEDLPENTEATFQPERSNFEKFNLAFSSLQIITDIALANLSDKPYYYTSSALIKTCELVNNFKEKWLKITTKVTIPPRDPNQEYQRLIDDLADIFESISFKTYIRRYPATKPQDTECTSNKDPISCSVICGDDDNENFIQSCPEHAIHEKCRAAYEASILKDLMSEFDYAQPGLRDIKTLYVQEENHRYTQITLSISKDKLSNCPSCRNQFIEGTPDIHVESFKERMPRPILAPEFTEFQNAPYRISVNLVN
jgi:hypothetical protein